MIIKGLQALQGGFDINQAVSTLTGGKGVLPTSINDGAGKFLNELINKSESLLASKAGQSGGGLSEIFQAPGVRGTPTGSISEESGKFLGDLVKKVNELQQQADKEIQKISTGESQGLHEVMLAIEKSGVSFQFLTQVRNKAVDAYQEIMRMQV